MGRMSRSAKKGRKKRDESVEAPTRFGGIAREVLRVFVDDLSTFMSAIERPYAYRAAMAGIASDEWERMLQDKRTARAIERMRKKKWITDRKKGNRVIVELSTDALIQAIKERIISQRQPLTHERQCYVLFDFPTGANASRAAWRRFLYEAGFRPMQLSVWVTDKNVGSELSLLISLLKINDWVTVVIGSQNF